MHNVLKREARTIKFRGVYCLDIFKPQEIGGKTRWNRRTDLASQHLRTVLSKLWSMSNVCAELGTGTTS